MSSDKCLSKERKLVYRLFSLSYPERMKLLAELDLFNPVVDAGKDDSAVVRLALQRAIDRGELCGLEQAVCRAVAK